MNTYHLDDIPEHLKGYFEPVPQIGLEPTPDQFVATMVAVFREARRALRDDGVCWVNLGDSYVSSPAGNFGPNMTAPANGGRYRANKPKMKFNIAPKNLLGIPWRVALALQADGWILRSDVIWSKPNPMPESVTDRPTKAHEYCFLLVKSGRYWWDAEAVREPASEASLARINQSNFHNQTGGPKDYGATGINPSRSMRKTLENFAANPGRNLRTVWEVATEPTPFAHFATFPRKLIEPMIKAGCPDKVCSKCGKPWEHIVERTEYKPEIVASGERFVDVSRGDKTRKLSGKDYAKQVQIIGETYRPACNCNADISTGLVLDPFMGSGTTGLVARSLGRDYVGCDLNPEYVKLAQSRLELPLLDLVEQPELVEAFYG